MKIFKGTFVPVAFVVLLLGGFHAQGLTFFVTQTNDSTEETSLGGVLLKKIKVRGTVVPEPSLRGAIIAANRRGGFNTILLQPKTYKLSLAGADEDGARSGDLDITHGNLTITVVGNGNATIDATGLGDRVFQIFSNASLALSQIKITGGNSPQNGGAIFNAGKLLLMKCYLIQNTISFPSEDSGGGSINIGTTRLYLVELPGRNGGAIFNQGYMHVQLCSFVRNSAGIGAFPLNSGNGGGICNFGETVIVNSIFSSNTAGDATVIFDEFSLPTKTSGGDGGGIWNSGQITIKNTKIDSNLTGKELNDGDPTLYIGGNGGNGAGVFNSGKIKAENCIINGNICGNGGSAYFGSNGGDGGSGAGIFNTGDFTLSGGAVLDNACGNGGINSYEGNGGNGGVGAGIYNSGTVSLLNCTISGNTNGNGANGGLRMTENGNGGSGGDGGGLYNSGMLGVMSCTICSNTCGFGGDGGFGQPPFPNQKYVFSGNGGNGGSGGGIFNAPSMGTLRVCNSIIAMNRNGTNGIEGDIFFSPNPPFNEIGQKGTPGIVGQGADVYGDLISHGFNLISVSDGSTGFTNGVNADQAGSLAAPIDPLIGPLQMNGGPTPTHALLPGSPAIDQGKSFGQKFDQRGHHRPHDFSFIPNAPGGDGSDIGAFELEN